MSVGRDIPLAEQSKPRLLERAANQLWEWVFWSTLCFLVLFAQVFAVEQYHKQRLRLLGATHVAIGGKGGTFVEVPPTIDAGGFLERGAGSMDWLSRRDYRVTVRLNDTNVTDADLAHLRSVAGRIDVDLRGTAVTDAGVRSLQGMRNVFLDVSNTSVKDETVAESQKSTVLPHLMKRAE